MATSCDLNAPRCTTEVLRVRFHGSRGGVFVGRRPPRDPGDPPHYDIFIGSFTSIQTCPTHTHNTHTHLLRTIIANSDVECILRAKTLQLYLTGMGRWKDPRNHQEATISIARSRWMSCKLTLPFNCQMRNADCDNNAVKKRNPQNRKWSTCRFWA